MKNSKLNPTPNSVPAKSRAANSIRAAIASSADLGDAAAADLFTEISRKLDKSLWMLEASQ
jgi:starvation-inducible DNA-binding protein